MKNGVSIKYVDITKDMYERVVSNIISCDGVSSDFSITTGLYKGIALGLFLFAVLMDELIRTI